MTPILEPTSALRLVIWGGWLLAALGAAKLVVWLVGEFLPGVYAKLRSDFLRRFFTGGPNRLLFGLGGCLTVLLGLFFVFLGYLLLRLNLVVGTG